MGLESIVDVQISRQTQGVSQAGFGTPLILGPNGTPGQIKKYSSLAAMLDDYTDSDAEYKEAVAIFSQTPHPISVKVGKTSTPVAQVVTFTPNVDSQQVQDYTVELNGTEYTFTSDASPTPAEVVTGLIALINGDTQPITASGTTTLICTADNAGEGFSYSNSANIPGVLTTPNTGIASDILSAIDIDNDWYLLLTTAKDDTTVKEAAKTIETLKKLYAFRNDDADVRTAVTNDLVSELKAKSYFRTFVFYTGTANDYGEAAMAARFLPLNPGSEQWNYKTLAGVTVDAWTDNEQAILDSKHANYYLTKGGVNVIIGGKVVGNEWIDVIRFVDWLQARIQERIFGLLYQNDKIPMTDKGISIVEANLRDVLDDGVKAGGISTYTVAVPKISEISPSDRANRIMSGITFEAVLAGGVNQVRIQGVVTV